MATNANLQYSRREKQDEFFTQYSTIEEELWFYKEHFKNKTIYCNCDNPKFSQFWAFFYNNFNKLKLKTLYSTYISDSPLLYIYDGKSVAIQKINGDGSYDSKECLKILDKSDLCITNPPYSLFKNYMNLLLNKNKQFIVLGNLNSATYTNIMPLITQRKIWLGVNSGHYWFKVPSWYEEKKTDFKIDKQGQKWRRMGNICWYTNLDIPEMHKNIHLSSKFSDKYPNCTNLDAIFIKYVAEIPDDYFGNMAVPITILPKLSPEQFELLGFDRELTKDNSRVKLLINGIEKTQYARLIIRRNTSCL